MLIGRLHKYLMAGNPGFLTRNPVKCTVWILPLDLSARPGAVLPVAALFSYCRPLCLPRFLVLSFVNEKHT
jgi:hypothetical protein